MSEALIEAVAKASCDNVYQRHGLPSPWPHLPTDIRDAWTSSARAALAAIEAQGYRVVPVEPTEEMAEKARNAIYDSAPSKIRARSVYAAMLSAAPKIKEGGE